MYASFLRNAKGANSEKPGKKTDHLPDSPLVAFQIRCGFGTLSETSQMALKHILYLDQFTQNKSYATPFTIPEIDNLPAKSHAHVENRQLKHQ